MRLLIASSTDLACSEPVIVAVGEHPKTTAMFHALKRKLREFADGLEACENGKPCCEIVVNGGITIKIFNKVDMLTKIQDVAKVVSDTDGKVYLHKLNAPCGAVDYWDIFTIKKI